jgi:hypothetical protein
MTKKSKGIESTINIILDGLENVIYFMYSRDDYKEKFHLFEAKREPEMFDHTQPYPTICGRQLMVNGARYTRYTKKSNFRLSTICKHCLKKIQKEPKRYGFKTVEVLIKREE